MKRLKLGVLYKNWEGWIGGTYYIQNLVHALSTLPDDHKPEIVVFSSTIEEFEQIRKINYPYLSYREFKAVETKQSIIKRNINRVLAKLNLQSLSQPPVMLDADDIDAVFPAPPMYRPTNKQKRVFWIPDFQELYYPAFFSPGEIELRIQGHKLIAASTDVVIFSSEDVHKDFKKFYPDYKCKTAVVHFAVTHPVLPGAGLGSLKEKYGLSKDYFIAPNQFWAHKNHNVIIDAAKILKTEQRLKFEIAFTGKEEDYRNPEYAQNLKQRVKDLGLENEVKFLGFIDRTDQLQLIKGALAVIQPSLFEGWSTVVEDTKAQNQHIIASDLKVHKEQLTNYPHLMFEKNNSNDLGEKIKMMMDFSRQPVRYDYSMDISRFARTILKVLLEEETVPLTTMNSKSSFFNV